MNGTALGILRKGKCASLIPLWNTNHDLHSTAQLILLGCCNYTYALCVFKWNHQSIHQELM